MKKKEKKQKQKIKRESASMSNMDKFMLMFLVALTVYLAIILPISLCVIAFSWHWLIFSMAIVLIPLLFVCFQLWVQRRVGLTEAQKKNASVATVKYILYFWLLDCLYMTIFNQWKVWIYILSIITLIKVFYSLTVTFLGKKQKNAIFDISIIFDFLLGVGLTIYLIYLIPEKFDNLQIIVTTIVAAIYGGLLTLVGVAWTIKQQEKIRCEDEKKKYRPILLVTSVVDQNTKMIPLTEFSENKISYTKSDLLPYETYLNPIAIRNTEFTPFYIYGIIIDNISLLTANKVYIDRKGSFVISCEQQSIFTKTEIHSISLLTQDLLENFYEIPLKIEKVNSREIGLPCFRPGCIRFLDKEIPQIICKDEMMAIELKDFSLKEN